MRVIANSVFVVVLVLLAEVAASATGQSLANSNSGRESPGRGGERRVYLEPQQESGQVEVSGGCVTFLTEVRYSLALPFGQSVEGVLPAGASWPLPPGGYRLDNPPRYRVGLLLDASGSCGASAPR